MHKLIIKFYPFGAQNDEAFFLATTKPKIKIKYNKNKIKISKKNGKPLLLPENISFLCLCLNTKIQSKNCGRTGINYLININIIFYVAYLWVHSRAVLTKASWSVLY